MASTWIEVSNKRIGEIEIHDVFISKELGFYRLKIIAKITIDADVEINQIPFNSFKTPVIFGDVRLKLTLSNGNKNIGYAFPEMPIWLKSKDNGKNVNEFDFVVDINQKTLDAIEEVRAGTNDLSLGCKFEGVIFSGDALNPWLCPNLICHGIQIQIPQSVWCKKLIDCGYCKTMLIEVKIPTKQNSPFYAIAEELEKLNEKSLSAQCKDVISNCRDIIEKIDNVYNKLEPEVESEVKPEKNDRRLSKKARIYKYRNALRNISNLAHHDADEAAVTANWNRKDVEMMIGNIALLLQWLDDSQYRG